MASSPSKMLAFGASPGPKRRVNVTASSSSLTPLAAKKPDASSAPESRKSKSGGRAMQVVAALATLALAAAVARWLGGGASVEVSSSSSSPAAAAADPPAAAVATEVAFDAEDPDSLPLPGLHVDGGSNAPRPSGSIGSWPARVRVERQRLRPRKRGAMERAVEVRRV